MSITAFRPPVHTEEIISKNAGPEGHVSSISLLLRDANNKLFALHVATDTNYISSSNEFDDGEEHVEFPAPVFVVPTMDIDDNLLSNIVNGTDPEVLSMYLIAQDE